PRLCRHYRRVLQLDPRRRSPTDPVGPQRRALPARGMGPHRRPRRPPPLTVRPFHAEDAFPWRPNWAIFGTRSLRRTARVVLVRRQAAVGEEDLASHKAGRI